MNISAMRRTPPKLPTRAPFREGILARWRHLLSRPATLDFARSLRDDFHRGSHIASTTTSHPLPLRYVARASLRLSIWRIGRRITGTLAGRIVRLYAR